MRKLLAVLSLLYIAGCSSQTISNPHQQPQIIYNINVTNYEDDLFHVSVLVNNLTEKNNVYNFAATAPGTYQKMDFGRYVKSFEAFDDEGNLLNTNKISKNRWEIENINALVKIKYVIEDTFDSEIKKNPPAAMSGSGIDEKFISINTFAVLGYFEELQSHPSKLKLDYNQDWTVGTALNKNDDGYYYTETYDRLADSPILMGELTTAFTKVGDIDVEIYVYSPDTTINATKVLSLADEVLQSS
ncbi:MAG: peptidase, partial [Bacteroidota bacterium]